MLAACGGQAEGLVARGGKEKSATVFLDMGEPAKDACILVKKCAEGKLSIRDMVVLFYRQPS